MQLIPLENTPQQVFDITIAGRAFTVSLRTIQDLTYMSCFIDGEPLFLNQICTPNNWVNQYRYISVGGKFFFNCQDAEYPHFERFGITQNLIFMTTEEVAAYDAAMTARKQAAA